MCWRLATLWKNHLVYNLCNIWLSYRVELENGWPLSGFFCDLPTCAHTQISWGENWGWSPNQSMSLLPQKVMITLHLCPPYSCVGAQQPIGVGVSRWDPDRRHRGTLSPHLPLSQPQLVRTLHLLHQQNQEWFGHFGAQLALLTAFPHWLQPLLQIVSLLVELTRIELPPGRIYYLFIMLSQFISRWIWPLHHSSNYRYLACGLKKD